VIGLWLVLAALGMLFVSSMLLYILMRSHVFGHTSDEPIKMPMVAWGSTAVLLAGSFTAHRAVIAIRRERLGTCLKFLYITLALAVLFLIVQSPCMAEVLIQHRQLVTAAEANQVPGQNVRVSLYGLVFILILLHALHVLGGIIALTVVSWRARRQVYDHENYMGVQFAARYWHFLDIVWISMFTMFLVMG
jgi:heme/copper-type cytochrome/quinol oxidase subunit 3